MKECYENIFGLCTISNLCSPLPRPFSSIHSISNPNFLQNGATFTIKYEVKYDKGRFINLE